MTIVYHRSHETSNVNKEFCFHPNLNWQILNGKHNFSFAFYVPVKRTQTQKMFIKPFRVKSHTQMKGSDKKKFKSQVKTQFSTPDCDASIIDSLLPTKEEATITKIYTHNGDSVLVYSVGKDPLFFEIDKQKVLYPTVYTLWKYPELLGRKFMSTVAGVVPKITRGADVMLVSLMNYCN